MIKFKSIRWKNFLSTGDEYTMINLSDNPTNLIVGDNGSGKSTLLDALTYGLFGKPFRKINKPQLVNSVNDRDLVVDVAFDIGNKSYIIRRGMKPSIFEIYIDGIVIDQNARTKEYQEILEKNILKLNYKSFTQIIVLGSSSFQPFMQLTASSRREVIEDLLGIQVFSIMNQLVRERLGELSEDIRVNHYDMELNTDKVKLQRKYITEVQEINNDKIQKTKDDISKNNGTITEDTKHIKEIQKEISDIQVDIKGYDEVEVEKTDLVELHSQIKTNSTNFNKELKFFDKYDTCPSCKQTIDDDHKCNVIESRKLKIEEFDKAMVDISTKIDNCIYKLNGKAELLDVISEKESEIQKFNSQIFASNEYIGKLNGEIAYLYKVKEKSLGDDERLSEYVSNGEILESTRERLLEDKKYYEVSTSLLKDTGIKTTIIKKYLPVMNKLINGYLASMDSYFNFELDENFNEIIKSRFRDEFSYESFSEGEKMRIDLALLFTWRTVAKMKNSANTNLLILDEVFDSSLDTNGTDEFFKLLQDIGESVNVFVISHKGDTLSERFESILTFEKKGNFSKVR